MTDQEMTDLEAFLNTLTDDDVRSVTALPATFLFHAPHR